MNKERTCALYSATLKAFYSSEKQLVCEYYPREENERESGYLFSYFGMTGMIYQACKAGIESLDVFKNAIEGLFFYRSLPIGDGMVKYHSERGNSTDGGYGPCFFDDNIWVARNFLFAYELLRERKYLNEAIKIVKYTHIAWNNELGGLVWNENGLGENATEQELERGLSANACSILINAQLYQITRQDTYLQWAHKFYNFCKSMQDAETKMYYNGVHTIIENGKRFAGTINKDLYAYNPGSMVLADLVMQKITGDNTYFDDAVNAIKAAHNAFIRKGENGAPNYYKDFVWFLAILTEASKALWDEGYICKEIIESFNNSLNFAFDNLLNENGLLPHDYVIGYRTNVDTVYDRLALTHCGTAEIAILLFSMSK